MPSASGPASARVDPPVLLEQRQTVEARARDRDLEVIAATRSVLDPDLGRLGETPAGAASGGSRSPRHDGNDAPQAPPFVASLPERLLRAIAAALGGAVHETASLVLPRFVRTSRLYEATAKNVLRVTIELVGGVQPPRRRSDEFEPDPGRLAVRKGAGNAIELGSIAAFGFSPLWVLAAAADVAHGSRVYLDSFTRRAEGGRRHRRGRRPRERRRAARGTGGTSGTSARLIDIPPLELRPCAARSRTSAATPAQLPSPAELARAY